MSSWDNTQVMVMMLIHTRSYNNHGRWQHKGTRLEEESQSKADTLQKAEQALWTQVHGAKAGGTVLGRWCLVTAWWWLSSTSRSGQWRCYNNTNLTEYENAEVMEGVNCASFQRGKQMSQRKRMLLLHIHNQKKSRRDESSSLKR